MVEFFSVPLFSNDSDIYITNWGLLSDVQIKCLLVDRLHCVCVRARASECKPSQTQNSEYKS